MPPTPHTLCSGPVPVYTYSAGPICPGQGSPRGLLEMSGTRCAPHPGGPWLHGGRCGRTEGRNRGGGSRRLREVTGQSLLSPSPWLRPGGQQAPGLPPRGSPLRGPRYLPAPWGGANCVFPSPQGAPVPCAQPSGRPRPSRGLGFVLEFGLIFQEDCPGQSGAPGDIKTASSAALLGGCREGGSGVQL